jgi:cytochrome P450
VVASTDGDTLTSEELGWFVLILAVAGNETTRNAISHGMHAFLQNPDQWELYKAERPETTADEIVRVASPVTFMRRTATGDVSVSGHDFSEGDKVVLFYGAANRDPRAFDDPERFDIRRDPNSHVGFGGPGPHFCLGAHLARREVSVAFRQLLRRLPDIELTGEPVPLEAMGIPLVGGLKHVPVRFTPKAKVGA